jgi:hypothetical protein
VVQLGHIAVHDHAVEVREQRFECIRAPRAVGSSEVQVAQDQGSWDARWLIAVGRLISSAHLGLRNSNPP